MKIKFTLQLAAAGLIPFYTHSAFSALPIPFFECLHQKSGVPLNVTDMRELVKVTPVTYCANQPTAFNKNEMRELLQQGGNFQLAVHLANTNYTSAELVEMAQSRTYTLYVDSTRLTPGELTALSNAGVRMVVLSASAGLSKAQILSLATPKNLVLNVNSPIQRSELSEYLNAGVHLVIRSSMANLNRSDMVALSSAQPNLVTIVP